MNETFASLANIKGASRRVMRRLLSIGENRFELLLTEVEEGQQQLRKVVWLGVFGAVCGLGALVAFSAAIVVLLWHVAPVLTLLALGLFYAGSAAFFYWRAAVLQREWKPFSATLDQLRKDRECAEKGLS